VGILHRFDRVFRRKSAHHQGQLTIGCGLDGKTIDPQHVLRSVRTATVYFHDKLDILHGPFPFLNRPGLQPVSAVKHEHPDQRGFTVGKNPRSIVS